MGEGGDGRTAEGRSGAFFGKLLDESRSATALVDVEGTVRYASAGVVELLGMPAAGRSVLELLDPDDVERAMESLAIADAVKGIRYFPMVFRIRDAEGEAVEVDVVATNAIDDPDLRGLVLSLRRADERSQFIEPIRALAAGASHERVLELIASGMGRGGHALRPAFVAYEPDGAEGETRLVVVRASDELTAAVRGWLTDPVDGLPGEMAPREMRSLPAEHAPPPLASVLEAGGFAGLRIGAIASPREGEQVGLLVSAEPTAIWQEGAWSPSMIDHWAQLLDLATVAFERARAEARLVHAATHDPLTGLANRTLFFEQLARVASRDEVAVLYLDLDGFKPVNDHHGHACGDAVLAEVAARLRATVRPGDLVARLGGDEFAVAIPGADDALARDLADRLVEAIRAPLPEGAGATSVSVSIGIAHRRAGQSPDELVSAADRALLEAKGSGRGAVVRAG